MLKHRHLKLSCSVRKLNWEFETFRVLKFGREELFILTTVRHREEMNAKMKETFHLYFYFEFLKEGVAKSVVGGDEGRGVLNKSSLK